jgi:hypothetical protein
MASEPRQFFELSTVSANAREQWRSSLPFAAGWFNGKCPLPDPIASARAAAASIKLSGEAEQERLRTMRVLANLRCHEPG